MNPYDPYPIGEDTLSESIPLLDEAFDETIPDEMPLTAGQHELPEPQDDPE